MADKKQVACRRNGCAMKDTVVTTDATKCLSCGEELKPALDLAGLLKDLGL